jgi:hypothetical protein
MTFRSCGAGWAGRLAGLLALAVPAAAVADEETATFEDGPGEAWASAPDSDGGEINLTGAAPEDEEELAPWRGSGFTYRNVATIDSFDRGARMSWNPYYAMEFGFNARWWFDAIWGVGASFDVTRELTEADDTTYAGEAVFHDLRLSARARNFYTIPVVEIDLSADLILTLPTSKLSWARTLALGIGPGVSIGRTFELLGPLSVGYHVRGTGNLHETTTAQYETPLIPTCVSDGGGCEAFLNTGVRNVRGRIQHGVDLSWSPLEWLGVSTWFEHIVDWLYPIEEDDPRISYQPVDATDQRHASAFGVELTFTPLPALEIGFGYETVSPQLAPDSTYYNPFYNVYSTLYLDLRIDADGVLSLFTDS